MLDLCFPRTIDFRLTENYISLVLDKYCEYLVANFKLGRGQSNERWAYMPVAKSFQNMYLLYEHSIR